MTATTTDGVAPGHRIGEGRPNGGPAGHVVLEGEEEVAGKGARRSRSEIDGAPVTVRVEKDAELVARHKIAAALVEPEEIEIIERKLS